MNNEQIAKQRVADNPELTKHEETIFYDWSNWDEHMEWVATAPIEKIVSWAREIEGYSKSQAASTLRAIPSELRSQRSRDNGKAPVKPGSNPRGRPSTKKK